MLKTNMHGNDGVALVGTIGLLLVITTVGLGFLRMSSYESDSAGQRLDQLQAFWKAEEALSRTRAQMNKLREPDGFRGVTLDNDHERFTGKVTVRKMTQTDFDAYEIKSDVYYKKDGSRPFFSITSVEKPKTSGEYFMLYQDPGQPPPYFDTKDTINGPLHSNTYVALTGHPVFNGLVTTGDPFPGFKSLGFQRYTPPDHIENTGEIFPIPTSADKLRAQGTLIPGKPEQRAVIILTDNSYILRWRDVHNEANSAYDRTIPLPNVKGAGIFVEGDVEVSGVLSGRLTIGCSGDLIITDDILYSDANRSTGQPSPDSKNVLGLISEGNVFVKQNQVAPFIGRGIIIDASILAMDSTFSVLNYRAYQKSMGFMHLWGNVVQYQRGIIGNVRLRGTVEMGYHKAWHYDTRLKNIPPPFMPPLKDQQGIMRYKTIYWKRQDV